jgi:Na+/citrate or Na+/malate symporter
MTETVWIVLIIAAVIVVFALRKRLTSAALQFRRVKASITAQPSTEASAAGASGNLMAGANKIDMVEGATVSENTMAGKNEITVRSSPAPTAPKPPLA